MSAELRVGIAGIGTVGASAISLLKRHGQKLSQHCGKPISVTAVSARDRSRKRAVDLSDLEWFDNPVELAKNEDIDVFVELIGGDEGPAFDAVSEALKSSKHVVTANKALLARHGVALAKLAEETGVSLNFEAAVAGGVPIIKGLRESLVGNEVSRVYGILNGTCNYILSRMEREGITFETCLKDAQELGYAEADPTFDVEGFDTAHKLVILSSLAFGTKIEAEAIYVEGISSITPADVSAADELGYRIKLLGIAQKTDTGIEQRVHPTMVPKTTAIAQVDGVLNCVAVDADAVETVLLVGPGAGGDATASAVVSDIADIALGQTVSPLGRSHDQLVDHQPARMRRHEGGYYIRLNVKDRPGGFATIATAMAGEEISLESIVQKSGTGDDNVEAECRTAILVTYATTESSVRSALSAIAEQEVISGTPQVIRIEPSI